MKIWTVFKPVFIVSFYYFTLGCFQLSVPITIMIGNKKTWGSLFVFVFKSSLEGLMKYIMDKYGGALTFHNFSVLS